MALETGAFMQASSYSAEIVRRAMFAQYARTSANNPGIISGGLIGATDFQISQLSSPNMSVNVSTGEAIVPGNEGGSQGGYYVRGTSTSNLAISTADPTNPRVDTVCLTCGDAQYTLPSGGTSGSLTLQVVTGTPTAGATLSNLSGAAALPGSSLLLGYLLVPAGAGSIVTADIENVAVLAVPQFGVRSFNGRAGAVTPQNGDYGNNLIAKTIYGPSAFVAYDPNTSALTVLDATNLAVSFTAPPSGAVTVRLQAEIKVATAGASAGQGIIFAVFSGGSLIGPVLPAFSPITGPAASTYPLAVGDIEITGLASGSAYTFQWAAYSVSSYYQILAGNGVSITTPAPMAMKVYSA